MNTIKWFTQHWRKEREDEADAIMRLSVHAQVSYQSAWKVARGYSCGGAVQAAVLRVGRELGLDEAHFVNAPRYNPTSWRKREVKLKAATKARKAER